MTLTGALAQVAAAPTIAPPNTRDQDTQTETTSAPYDHWPPLPWADEPDLPDIVPASMVSTPNQDAFLKTRPHLTDNKTHWHGAKFLGFGSFGAVGLWCEADDQGNVIDRMVVKDNAAPPNAGMWRDPKDWRDHLPREIAIHRRIEARRTKNPDAFQYIVKNRDTACSCQSAGSGSTWTLPRVVA